MDVEVRGQLARAATPACAREQLGQLGDAAVELVDVGVDLDPVAGGEDQRLGDVLGWRRRRRAAWLTASPASAARSSSATGALPVGQAHDEDAHRPRPRPRRTAAGDRASRSRRRSSRATASRPPRDLALLVEGEDLQLDREVDLAHVDPSGTSSTTGAKFRMLVTPAATSRSQTSWAAAAGVAMTPMDDAVRR